MEKGIKEEDILIIILKETEYIAFTKENIKKEKVGKAN